MHIQRKLLSSDLFLIDSKEKKFFIKQVHYANSSTQQFSLFKKTVLYGYTQWKFET